MRILRIALVPAILAVISLSAAAESPFLVTELAPDLLLLGTDQGSYSNNSLVFTGPDGILLVDTHADVDAGALKEFVDGLGRGAPRYIVTTHGHVEHMGGTAIFGPDPVVIAHERFPERLRSGTYLFNEYPPATLPDVTVADTLTLRFNGEVIRVTAIGGSHDDHELMVHFTGRGVAHVSSVVNGFNFPSVDGDGDALGFARVVRRVAALLPPGTRLVSGHHGRSRGFAEVGRWAELEPYAAMMDSTVAIVRRGLGEGRTVEEMQVAGVLDEFVEYAGSYVGTDRWIATLAEAMTGPREDRPDVCRPLFDAWKRDGARAAVALHRRLRDEEPEAWDFDELQLLGIGAKLAGRGLHADAEVFLNGSLDAHPDGEYAFYAAHLLAGSLRALGRDDEAVAAARRSLDLNPEYGGARELLAELAGPAALLPEHEIGRVDGTREITIRSRFLGEERRLLVRLPRGYEDGDEAYPVLLMLDAEWHFNLAAADVELLSECSYLGAHPVPQMIVVGVVNTDRNRDFTPTLRPEQLGMRFPTSGGSAAFRRFLVDEVLPVVDTTYRTRPFRVLAGWSLGGLFTVNSLFAQDSPFDAHLAISPSLWWDDGWTLERLRSGAPAKGGDAARQFVVTLGTVEQERTSSVARSTQAFLDHLAEHPLPGVETELVTLEGMGHNFSPKVAYFYGLAAIFADLNLPADVAGQGLAAVDAYYAGLSSRYRTEMTVPESVYGQMGWGLFEDDRFEEAGEVFRAWTDRHPRSSVAWASLGSFCRERGDAPRAADLFREAIALEEASASPRQSFIQDLRRDIDAIASGD